MRTQLITHPGRSRCYECGSPRIESICHHCGKAICLEHLPQLTKANGRLLTAEFTGLGLENTTCGEAPVHCRECQHIVRAPSLVPYVLGAMTLILGLLWRFYGGGLIGIYLAGIGLTLAGMGLAVNVYRKNRLMAAKPPLPLVPRFDVVKLQERLRGTVVLDSEGGYHTSTSPATGKLEVSANLGEPERRQLQKYRKKYQLQDEDDIAYHAGFIALGGPAAIEWMRPEHAIDKRGHVIGLTGDVGSQPVLVSEERDSAKWSLHRDWHVWRGERNGELPVRIIPYIEMETAKRVLYLQVQWGDAAKEFQGDVHRIEELELHVPIDWGEIERMSDASSASIKKSSPDGEESTNTITWRQISISDHRAIELRRYNFYIRFERDIDLAESVTGKLKINFNTSISGIDEVRHYHPLGGFREERPAQIKTSVDCDFDLSLAGLRHQETRMVPDAKVEEDQARETVMLFAGVTPDHVTVTTLVDAMSNEGFYIKSVIEHPPRTSGRANAVNHVWDILGRRYLEIYPVDFHVVVSGEEILEETSDVATGTTKVSLTTQGVYSNEDVESSIVNVWEQIHHLVGEQLSQMVRTPRTEPRMTARQAEEAAWPHSREPHEFAETGYGPRFRNKMETLMNVIVDSLLSDDLFLELKSSFERIVQRSRVTV